jgi:hypothetical protein
MSKRDSKIPLKHQQDTVVLQVNDDVTLHLRRSLSVTVGLPSSLIKQNVAYSWKTVTFADESLTDNL